MSENSSTPLSLSHQLILSITSDLLIKFVFKTFFHSSKNCIRGFFSSPAAVLQRLNSKRVVVEKL